ncbi:MAG: DUF6671 family protein [Alphaproteobacteria bacterium]|jgi:hypothetical protein
MAKVDALGTSFSCYDGTCIILTTKHQKASAVAPVFDRLLGAGVLECILDTDELGTFTGEVERQSSALECARRKCEWGMKATGSSYGLASEGSFGAHPTISFLPANTEILYFMDKERNLTLHVMDHYLETNYQMGAFSCFEEIEFFAKKALFPSHALIVKSHPEDHQKVLFKGIANRYDLEAACKEALKTSSIGKIWVETDMRAHLNPTRMRMIGALSQTLAKRLLCHCPRCGTPGWGKVSVVAGLPCSWCETPTKEVKEVVEGCAFCRYEQSALKDPDKSTADPGLCLVCNP